MPRTIRVIAVGLLVLVLASSSLMALPSPARMDPRPEPSLEARDLIKAAWDWIADVLTLRPESSSYERPPVKSEQGSQLDPDGNH
jgi:hypothetical protein